MRHLVGCVILAAFVCAPAPDLPADLGSVVSERAMKLTRESVWRLTDRVAIAFRTFHPQGLVKIGGAFFVSSVEVTVRTKPLPDGRGDFDRDTGAGVGHLFKFDAAGTLLGDLKLGDAAMYHPGGIDYDGTNIWIPVAEYRPNSRSIVYRVDPVTMKATEVFRFDPQSGVDRGDRHGAARLFHARGRPVDALHI